MRNDDPIHPAPGLDPSPDGRPETARPRSGGASTAALALLIAGTCWVVASWASAWLVPPYLILMAVLLLPPAGRPQGDPAGAGLDSADALGPARPGEGAADPPAPETPPAPAGASGDLDPAAELPPTRGRRGKGRARKTKPVEPSPATWVEVAPGKFVRVEAPQPATEAGPHQPVGVPVEVPATPQPQPQQADEAGQPDGAEVSVPGEEPRGSESDPGSEAKVAAPAFAGEPVGDALPAFDPIEGPGGDPPGGVVASGSTTASGSVEGGDPPGEFEGLPAADGIAPRAEGPFEDSGADQPDAGSGAADGRPALADVAPGDVDEPMVAFEGGDPTETAVDETVLDDAAPFVDATGDPDAPKAVDAPEPDAPRGVPSGSTRWPRRLAPRARTRAGIDPRALGRGAPPRRPARSHGPSRRPPDPRRLTRRGDRRPRQATRTFPPRSPPRGRSAGPCPSPSPLVPAPAR